MPLRTASVFVFVACFCVTGVRAEGRGLEFPERFDYRWSLAGFRGAVARLFVPGRGEGRLTTSSAREDGSLDFLKTELLISSRDGEKEEFWLYGAEIDATKKRTVRAWSRQRFRGRSREKEREAGKVDALDLASSIFYLRRERPDLPREEMIWSSGRLNPVIIRPGPRGSALWNGRRVATRFYSIRGVSRRGQPRWEGKMDLVVTDDEQAIPLEIVVARKGLRIRLELVESVE